MRKYSAPERRCSFSPNICLAKLTKQQIFEQEIIKEKKPKSFYYLK